MAMNGHTVALVTGASSGIGHATVETLVQRGLRVVAAARRRDRLDELAARHGAAVLPLELDVTDAGAVAALPDALPADWRAVDVLVNAAGSDVGGRRRFDRVDIEEAAGTIEANVTGPMRVARALLPGMLARGRGHVVAIGSIQAYQVFAGSAAYTASKHAVHGLMRTLRADLAGTGVRVTEVLPGLVRSEFAEVRWRGDAARAQEFYDGFKAVMVPADVARAVLYALDQPPHLQVAEIHLTPSA